MARISDPEKSRAFYETHTPALVRVPDGTHIACALSPNPCRPGLSAWRHIAHEQAASTRLFKRRVAEFLGRGLTHASRFRDCVPADDA